jgi:hypothetical protein
MTIGMIRFSWVCVLLLGCAARSEIAGEGVDASATETSTPDAGTDACGEIEGNLDQAAKLAAACCTTCNSLQCAGQLPGVCCPLAVTVTSSEAATAYLSALDTFKKSGCPIFCPFGCPAPQRSCEQSGVCAQP